MTARRAWLLAAVSAAALWSQPTARAQDAQSLDSFRRVSLVFASESLASPISMFGHTFVAFHNEPFPEPDAVVVEFVGHLEGVRMGVLRGLFAAIPGQFRLGYFRDKAREYDGEDRDLWIHELGLAPDERATLIRSVNHHLAHAETYNFVLGNCSQRIHVLLTGSLDSFTCHIKPHALPVDSVRAFARCGRITSTLWRPSQLRHALALHAALDGDDKKRWRDSLQPAALANVQSPSSSSSPSSALGAAVGAALDYQMPREADGARRAWLFLQKKLFPAGFTQAQPVATGLTGRGQTLVQLDAFPRQRWVGLRFQLVQEGLLSQNNPDLMNSQVDMVRLGVTAGRDTIRPSELVVLNVEALVGSTLLGPGLVRKFALGYHDWNGRAGFAASALHLEFGGGFAARPGRAVSLGTIFSGGFGRQNLLGAISYSFFPRWLLQMTIHPGSLSALRWRSRVAAQLWNYRTLVFQAGSELGLLVGQHWAIVASVDAMGTRDVHGVGASAGLALTF